MDFVRKNTSRGTPHSRESAPTCRLVMCWICDATVPECEWAHFRDPDCVLIDPVRRSHHRFEPWDLFSSLHPPNAPGSTWETDAPEAATEPRPQEAPPRDAVLVQLSVPGTTRCPHLFCKRFVFSSLLH